jgi:hypothetical protein
VPINVDPSRFGVARASATVRSRPDLDHASTENGFECCPLSTGLKQLAAAFKKGRRPVAEVPHRAPGTAAGPHRDAAAEDETAGG